MNNPFYNRLNRAQKIRFFIACAVIPIRFVLVIFAFIGEYAEAINEAIDMYGKRFIKGNEK